MASNYTENFGLCQWEATDQVLREDFNEDNLKIDATLKNQGNSLSNLSAQLVNKANNETVNSLSAKLDQEIQDRKNAVSTEANARAAALLLKGNCQIYYNTYVGDGNYTRTMTFPGRPLLVLAMNYNLFCYAIQGNSEFVCKLSGEGGQLCDCSWSGNSFTWSGNRPDNANNVDTTYYQVVLMAADE